MITMLRILRAICGWIGCSAGLGLILLMSGMRSPLPADAGSLELAWLVAGTCFGVSLFFGLRSFANALHQRRHGAPHPSLDRSVWHL
jgi:hypothetical protein